MDMQISPPSTQPFQIILLAGGKGQKLFPLADRYPKPLLPIANKPLIAYQLEHLEKMGFFEVLILHRHSKTLEKYLKSEYKGRMQIETVEINEDSTNNVEALKQIWNKITRDFIVIPCDLLTDVNFDDILDQHIITQASVTMVFRETPSTKPPAGKKEALKENKDESDDYDVVVLDDDTHRVLQITNNSDLEGEGLSIKKTMLLRHPKATISTQLYECHLYVFNYRMIDFLKNCKRKFSNIKDDLIPFLIQNQYNKKLDREFFTEEYLDEEQLEKPKNLKEPEKKKKHVSIFGYISRNTYCKRINVINEYIQGNLDSFLRPPALPNCLFSTNNNEKESTEKKPADTLIGEGTKIGDKCLISRSVIGKNCVIGSNVKITKSVIMNNVVIENDCIIQDSVICSKATIKEKAKVKDDAIAHNETINP